MIRSFRFKARLAPSAIRKAEAGLAVLCELYNAGLEERKTAWEKAGVRIRHPSQSKQIKDIRKDRPAVGALPFDAAEICLKRLNLAFEAFFRRVKAGQVPGYPRFR